MYDIKRIIEKIKQNQVLYIKTYLEDPSAFAKLMVNDKDMAEFINDLQTKYSKDSQLRYIGILGYLCLFSSETLLPSDKASMTTYLDAQRLKTNSGNGSFTVYDTCCNKTIFVKVVVDKHTDALEVETIALQLVKHKMDPIYKRFFLQYFASGSCFTNKTKTYDGRQVPNMYLNNLENVFEYKNIVKKTNTSIDIKPFVITNAVPSGIALRTLLRAWMAGKHDPTTLDQLSLQNLQLFHKDNSLSFFNNIPPQSVFNKNGAYILSKLHEFYVGALKGASRF